MDKTNNTAAVKLSKLELVRMLADHRVDTFPTLYGRRANGTAEHYADAKMFVTNHLGPTKRDMLTAAYAFGLIPHTVKVR